MSNSHQKASHHQQWAMAEQWFMRLIALALLTTAVVSMIFGVFPVGENNATLVRAVNIMMTLLIGVGSLWSFWWSSSQKRIDTMIDGFKASGAGRTYAVAGMQGIVGLLFTGEWLNGNVTLGMLGLIMLLSALFFIWRAQQIKTAN